MTEYRSPLRIVGADGQAAIACNHCEEPLGLATENWKGHAASRSWPLAERAAHLGAKVRPTAALALMTWEHYCPACGSLLAVEYLEDGEAPPHDIRLGDTTAERGEAF